MAVHASSTRRSSSRGGAPGDRARAEHRQAARDLGLNDNLLARWKKELAQQGSRRFQARPSSGG
jgi:transposase-like protein